MQECYDIETVEQLRAIADIRRVRILELLRDQPMTVTQLGELMGEAPAKVHYHVRELERVGLLRLVETREKGGILEKYYQPIAREITVEKQLISGPPDEALAATGAFLNQIRAGFQRALRSALEQKEQQPNVALGASYIYITPEEQKQLGKQIIDLLKPYETRRGIEGEIEMMNALIVYPLQPTLPRASESSTMPAAGQRSSDVGVTITSSTETAPDLSTWAVGVVHFGRSELEKALAEGKRLRIFVVGLCRFAGDVSSDLVDHAVDEFHLIGRLEASAAVRDVLMKKHL